MEGAANKALIRLLADEIGVAASAVTIEHGQRGRLKTVSVVGVSPDELRSKWPGGTFESAAR